MNGLVMGIMGGVDYLIESSDMDQESLEQREPGTL
jgi:hypothetical protein